MRTSRYRAEYWIRQSINELEHYSKVFTDRVVPAFGHLDEEAEKVRDEAYARACANSGNPEFDDEASICEWAQDQGGDFYAAVDAIRQGVFNLMVAGLYHMLEQHADRLLRELEGTGLPPLPEPQEVKYHFDRLTKYLRVLKVPVTEFKSWGLVDELKLVANTVKHGEGGSAEELKKRNPSLFARPGPFGQLGIPCSLPVLPVAGQGIYLCEADFERYRKALVDFWNELAEALLPICSPQ